MELLELAVESPTRAPCAVTPASPHLVHLTKGGGVEFFGAAPGLCRRESYFFLFPRPLLFREPETTVQPMLPSASETTCRAPGAGKTRNGCSYCWSSISVTWRFGASR